MKLSAFEVRVGNLIEYQSKLWRVLKKNHVKPGKGGAYLQVELKEIRTGTKLNERFRSSEKVERATLEQREYQYLYPEGDQFTFMDNETYEQVTLDVEFIGEDQARFLQDGMVVIIEQHEGSPIGVQLPDTITAEVVEADAVVKGQTASSSYKPAMLENGVKTLVPPHIESGTRVVVNTADGSYVERAKG